MRRFAVAVATLAMFALIGGPALGAAGVDATTRTATIGPLVVRWSLTNPEAITYVSWDGSTNLTNSWANPNCPANTILNRPAMPRSRASTGSGGTGR